MLTDIVGPKSFVHYLFYTDGLFLRQPGLDEWKMSAQFTLKSIERNLIF